MNIRVKYFFLIVALLFSLSELIIRPERTADVKNLVYTHAELEMMMTRPACLSE
jgi:hypothetical protein